MANVAIALAVNTAKAAATALAARAISNAFTPDTQGPRLEQLRLQSSTEGASLPMVYGTTRLGGQVIWATQFQEYSSETSSSGGKGGGPTTTSYTYSLSFALALCAGEIGGIGRVWADGAALDLSTLTYRVYRGTEDQAVDPLIETIEGAGDPPAFRGTAYIVFEDFSLEPFANRMPQLNVEVFRTPTLDDGLARLETHLGGVGLLPGSGEFAYATEAVRRQTSPGEDAFENVNNARGKADVLASLDDLEAQAPGVKSVMIIVSWFGDDLRVGETQIRPAVEIDAKTTSPLTWQVNGQTRANAYVISQTDGRANYGGTPSDNTVIQLIAELKARGYEVGLYPFILMDITADNTLPDPYGGTNQGAFPWRGRITCHPAAGTAASVDQTAAAGTQVSAFFGSCNTSDFAVSDNGIAYSGPDEWSFRRFMLHHAHLAIAGGGVDLFVMGSEMRGLTTIRDGAGSYPAVSHLQTLAGDVRAVLGSATTLTYAADWSEYFGHQPNDGTGDVYFHLDPLWADANIDCIGLDWYIPLSDWRDDPTQTDAHLATTGRERDYLSGYVEGGEGYDWYYASDSDRTTQSRTAITDDTVGKPWVFRYKDLRNWWSNAHYNRPSGVEAATATAWLPQSKPFMFIETGCPAADCGANQPNVFYDPKSSESHLPYFSSGDRDDVIQRRYIETLLRYWDEAAGNNPKSNVYGGPMVDIAATHAWAWDARPYPDFPSLDDVWTDGDNWTLGHWLNGRLGTLDPVLAAVDLGANAGLNFAYEESDDILTGFVIDRAMPLRNALEPLFQIYDLRIASRADSLIVLPNTGQTSTSLALDGVVPTSETSRIARMLADAGQTPLTAQLAFYDIANDLQAASVTVRLPGSEARPTLAVTAPISLDHDGAEHIARHWLTAAAIAREEVDIRLPPSDLALEPGDVVSLPELSDTPFEINSIADDHYRELSLSPVTTRTPRVSGNTAIASAGSVTPTSIPLGLVMDIPLLPDETSRSGPRVAARTTPWPGSLAVSAGTDTASLSSRATLETSATLGELLADLPPGRQDVWDNANAVDVMLYDGSLASADETSVLAGSNAIAIAADNDEWELIQFRNAQLTAPNTYRLTGLLRAQSGSELGMATTHAAGAQIVAFTGAAMEATTNSYERGASLTWRFSPIGYETSTASAYDIPQTYNARHERPLSPVHFRASRSSDGVTLSWIRQTRVSGDDWESADVPLGETTESYTVEILDGQSVVWTANATTSSILLSTADEAAALSGAPVTSLTVRIAQNSESFGAGIPRTEEVAVD